MITAESPAAAVGLLLPAGRIRALTLRQPWATAVAELGKRVENRTWRLPPGYLWIHAGARSGWDPAGPAHPAFAAAWRHRHGDASAGPGLAGMHLHKFGPLLFGEVRGEYDPAATLDACLARPGDVLGYVYDFGDLWTHRITLDKVTVRPRGPLPRCLAGRRACPPEDCGGPWGYETALKGLRARKGGAYRMAREACGPRFDPEAFDKTETNRQLAALAPAAAP